MVFSSPSRRLAFYLTGAALLGLVLVPTPLHAQNTLPPGQDPARNMAAAGYWSMWAETQDNPPAITLRFLYTKDGAGSALVLDIRRRVYSDAGDQPWVVVGQAPLNAVSWTDTTVEDGVIYEYMATRSPSGSSLLGTVAAGVNANNAVPRGTIIVVLAQNIVTGNLAAINQLYSDLIGDNWKVRTIMVPTFEDLPVQGSEWNNVRGMWSRHYPAKLRDLIRSVYYEDPANTKMLYFLGHVPIATSGTSVSVPDGHGSRSTFATDHFYADMDGVWTDSAYNRYNGSDTMRGGRNMPNFPQDGTYDPNTGVSRVEMGFGRVDPWDIGNQVWYTPELTANQRIARYLDKAHKFRHVQPFGPVGAEEVAGRRAVMRYTQGGQDGASSYGSSLLAMVGPHNMDNWISLSSLPPAVAPVTDEDVQWTVDHGPYLFYAQGSQVPPNNGDDHLSKAVNWSSMQSYFGDWHVDNDMRRHIFSNSMTLTWLYTGRFNPELFHHGLGVGEPIGSVMRLSMNFGTNARYFASSATTGQDFLRALVGDPALRMFPVPPVQNLVAQGSGNSVNLTWSAPAEMGEFQHYQVHRAAGMSEDFTLVADGLSQPQFTDSQAPMGPKVYKVQAIHRILTGSGYVSTNSQAQFASVGLQIEPMLLPPFRMGANGTFSLTTTGAQGAVQWSLLEGRLPAGITLASDGTLAGRPVIPGNHRVLIRAADSSGASALREFVVYVEGTQTDIMYFDLDETGGFGLTDRIFPLRKTTLRGSPTFLPEGGMQFDGVDDAIVVHYMGENAPPANGWADMKFLPPTARPSFSVQFKAAPTSAGGILLSRSTNLITTFPENLNVYTIRMLPDGRVQGWTRNFSPITTAANLKDNQWHHAVLTYDPADGRTYFYVDGVQIGSLGAGNKVVNEKVVIGARWNGTGETTTTDHFNGALKEVRCFSYGLSSAEVRALYEQMTLDRPDLNPAPPQLLATPVKVVLVSNGQNQIANFQVDTTHNEAAQIQVTSSNPAAFQSLFATRTAGGYRLHMRPAVGFLGDVTLTITLDDGWPGNVVRFTVPVTIGGGLTYAAWQAAIDWQAKDSTPEGDANSNGLSNLAEFFFGQDPMALEGPGSQPVSIQTIETTARGDRMVVRFPKQKGLVGVAYTIESSEDLVDWTPETNLFEVTQTADSTEEVDVVEIEIPISSSTNRKFARIQTQLTP